jgi:hypothetical protein
LITLSCITDTARCKNPQELVDIFNRNMTEILQRDLVARGCPD